MITSTSMAPIVSTLLTIGLASIGPVVALILVVVRARGTARTLGVVGLVLVLVGVVGTALTSLYLPLLLNRAHLSFRAIGLFFIPTRVVSVVALVLLGLAVGARRAPSRIGSSDDGRGW